MLNGVDALTVSSTISRKCTAMAGELGKANVKATNDGALIAKGAVLGELKRSVPSLRLKNVGKAGAKLNARYDVKGTTNATALLRATGPWQLVESNTDPHYIVAGLLGQSRASSQGKARLAGSVAAFGGTARGVFGGIRAASYTTRSGAQKTRAGKRALTVGGEVRAYAAHPGTTGRRPWHIGLRRSLAEINGLVKTTTNNAVLRGFKR